MAKSTCYKIMFVMGVIDMAAVIVVGLLTGYFGYFGFVFCSSPKFIYFVGVHNFCLYIISNLIIYSLIISLLGYRNYNGRNSSY